IAVTQSLARIYEVSEIMQLAHATSFHLCEARAAGDIPSDKDYLAALEHVFNTTGYIMLASAAHEAAQALPVLAAQVNQENQRIAAIEKDCKDTLDALRKGGATVQGDDCNAGVVGAPTRTELNASHPR